MIDIRIRTRGREVWTAAGALIMGLSLCAGCGVSGGGTGTSGPENQNQNQNGTSSSGGNQNTNTNTNGGANANANGNDNGGDGLLTAEIDGLPTGDLEIGQQIQLRAAVTNDAGNLTYEWIVDRGELATLSASDIANPILTTLGAGRFELVLAVTDSAATEGAKAVRQLVIAAAPEPPAEASLSVLPVPPAQVQEAVSLIADLSGPAPESASWEPSPDNIFDANTLFFENHDSGDPTRILATMVTASFPTIYELSFTITAVYSNGGSLSEEVVVTVMGGP